MEKFKMSFRTILLTGVAMAVGIKFFIDVFVPFQYEKNSLLLLSPTFHKDYGLYTPSDDHEIMETALFYMRGEGFLTSVSFNRPCFRKEKIIKTAFRPKFSVFMHIIGIKVYRSCHPSFDIAGKSDMPSDYYYCYGMILLFLKWLFFVPSIWFFWKLAEKLTNAKFALVLTFLYTIYPSQYYVGLLNVFEPIITYLMLIVLASLGLEDIEKSRNPVLLGVTGTMAILFCVWMKPHVLFTLTFFLMVCFVHDFKKRSWSRTLTLLMVYFVVSILAQVPILISNYKDFGKVFLANQAGIDFFHAHNPFARGSWTPNLFVNHGNELTRLISQDPQLPFYNEKQEADYYKHLAIQWIKDHPVDELLLFVKKILIFFLPHNFMCLKINLLTFFTHLGLLLYAYVFVKYDRYKEPVDWYVLCVLAAVLVLNTLYFVEYRWRFFADPEIIILSGVGYYYGVIEILRKRTEATKPSSEI